MKRGVKKLTILLLLFCLFLSGIFPVNANDFTPAPSDTSPVTAAPTDEPSDETGNLLNQILEMVQTVHDMVNGITSTFTEIKDTVSTIANGNYIDVLIEKVVDIVITIFSAVATKFMMLVDGTDDLLDTAVVKYFFSLSELFGWLLFCLGTFMAIINISIEYRDGELYTPIRQTVLNVFKGFISVLLFAKLPPAFYVFINFLAGEVIADLAVTGGVEYSFFAGRFKTELSAALLSLFSVVSPAATVVSILVLIYVIAAIVSLFKVSMSLIKRAGIMVVLTLLGALYMFSIPRGFWDPFWGWVKQMLGLCMQSLFQACLVFTGLFLMSVYIPQLNLIVTLAALGFLLVAAEVPRYMEKFGLDSSARSNVMHTVGSVSHTVMSVKSLLGAFAK